MNQIISVHIGGAGVKVGLSYWEQLSSRIQKFKQNKDAGNINVDRFYTQNKKGDKVPRAIFIDTDIRSKNTVLKSKINFDEGLLIGNGKSCDNLFAQGHYGDGAQLKDSFRQNLRKQIEKCDRINGFILTSSPTGGAGSGIGANVLQNLRQYYCNTIVQDFKILPGTDSSNKYTNLNSLQIYNIQLSMHYAIQNNDLMYIFQNNATAKILQNHGNVHCKISQINDYYGRCLNEHISSYLFSGLLNMDQRKRATNIVLFPRLKTLCGSLSQLGEKQYIYSALDAKNRLMHHDSPAEKRMFTMNVHVKDNWASEQQIHKLVYSGMKSQDSEFMEWIPTPLSMSMHRPEVPRGESAWILTNGRNNIEWVNKVSQLFTSQFRRKSFLFNYKQLGMDEMEFAEAQSNCNDLYSEYIPCGGDYDPDDQQIIGQPQ